MYIQTDQSTTTTTTTTRVQEREQGGLSSTTTTPTVPLLHLHRHPTPFCGSERPLFHIIYSTYPLSLLLLSPLRPLLRLRRESLTLTAERP
jgi:hypothetical protein